MPLCLQCWMDPKLESAGPGCCAVYGVGLWSLACWDCGFKSHQRHGCLSVVIVVCCQVELCDTSWSLIQRSSTKCGASCDLETSWMRRPWPTRELSHQKQTNKQIFQVTHELELPDRNCSNDSVCQMLVLRSPCIPSWCYTSFITCTSRHSIKIRLKSGMWEIQLVDWYRLYGLLNCILCAQSHSDHLATINN